MLAGRFLRERALDQALAVDGVRSGRQDELAADELHGDATAHALDVQMKDSRVQADAVHVEHFPVALVVIGDDVSGLEVDPVQLGQFRNNIRVRVHWQIPEI